MLRKPSCAVVQNPVTGANDRSLRLDDTSLSFPPVETKSDSKRPWLDLCPITGYLSGVRKAA